MDEILMYSELKNIGKNDKKMQFSRIFLHVTSIFHLALRHKKYLK